MDVWQRRRHHKGGTALRLATVGASSTRRRINQPQRVRCVLFAYQVPPGVEPLRANLLPISAGRRRRATSAANRRPRGVRGKAESDRGTTTGGARPRRPGRAGPRRDGRCRTGQGRSLAVTRCYINVLLNTDAMVCFDVKQSAAPLAAAAAKGAITSKIKHAIKLKTSPARLAQLLHNCCSSH